MPRPTALAISLLLFQTEAIAIGARYGVCFVSTHCNTCGPDEDGHIDTEYYCLYRLPGDLHDAEVLEVGPGPGGLTRALLAAGARVTAIERDHRCIPALAELGEAFPGQLTVIEGDALAIDAPSLFTTKPHIVSNLPYNVGTALLVGWLSADWAPWWQSLTLMFQKEVAERIVATTNSDHYGRLAVLAQWRSASRIAMPVHRSAFTPPPKVMSAVVHITPQAAPADVDFALLERLTGAAFGQRRKMLRQSLKSVPGALDALERIGIDGTRRAETLSVLDFVSLARAAKTRPLPVSG